jgi:hypothetical protein
MPAPGQQQQIDEQVALSKSLGLGFALSVIPAAGAGSIAALIIGLRAQKRIKASKHELTGRGMALWCVIVGSLGLAASICILGWMILSLV